MSEEAETREAGSEPLVTADEAEAFLRGMLPAQETVTGPANTNTLPVVEDFDLELERLRSELARVPSDRPLLREKLENEWALLAVAKEKQDTLDHIDELEEALASIEISPEAKAETDRLRKANAIRAERGLPPIAIIGEGDFYDDLAKKELKFARQKVEAFRAGEPTNVIEEVPTW